MVGCRQHLCFLSHKTFFIGDSLGLEFIGTIVMLDNSPEKKTKHETWGYMLIPSSDPWVKLPVK